MNTITENITQFIEHRSAQHYSQHTLRNYQNTFKALITWLGCDPDPAHLNAADLARFLASRAGLSRKTIRNYHADLSSLWGWMVSQGHAPVNILQQVPAPRPGVRAIAPFKRAEIADLIEAAAQGQRPERDRSIVLLLLDTGIRASELCNLKLSDISWKARRLRVIGKGDKERWLVFSDVTRQALISYLQGRKRGHLFEVNRRPISRHALVLIMRRLGQRAGVIRCHPHRLRHTFAIQFLRNGGNVYSLQAALGHSSLDMVKRYLQLTQVDLETQMERASPVAGWDLGLC